MKMVADKSKFDKVLVDQPQCGDFNKPNVNLDASITNQFSSSDESMQSKSESEERSDQSLDSSDKTEFGDENKKMCNSTYLCSKPLSVNDSELDKKIVKNEQYPSLTVLKTADDTVEWKYSSSSCTQNLDMSQWIDSKLENLIIKDSFDGQEMVNESTLLRIQKYLVDYQVIRGISRDQYTFSTLIRVMGQATGRCLFALFYVVLNIPPAVLEIFLHILRFVIDKIVNIKDTENIQQVIVKSAIFAVQVMCIYICLVFIFGFIVWPVIHMAFGILTKIMLYD